jgi:hypothetical protein
MDDENIDEQNRRVHNNAWAMHEALTLIQQAMSGEQDSDTFNTVEGILARAGYPVGDVADTSEQPNDNKLSYKVWLHIEEFDEEDGRGVSDVDPCISSTATFPTEERAIKFTRLLHEIGGLLTRNG